MQRNLLASLSVTRVARMLGGALAAAMMLAVPAFAISSIAPRVQPVEANKAFIPIAPGDELAAYGMQTPRQSVLAAKHHDAREAESTVLLRNWEYTGGPGHKRSGQP
jgi:hypothetical protein